MGSGGVGSTSTEACGESWVRQWRTGAGLGGLHSRMMISVCGQTGNGARMMRTISRAQGVWYEPWLPWCGGVSLVAGLSAGAHRWVRSFDGGGWGRGAGRRDRRAEGCCRWGCGARATDSGVQGGQKSRRWTRARFKAACSVRSVGGAIADLRYHIDLPRC